MHLYLIIGPFDDVACVKIVWIGYWSTEIMTPYRIRKCRMRGINRMELYHFPGAGVDDMADL